MAQDTFEPPPSEKTLTVECKCCGQPLTLGFYSTGDRTMDETMMTIAKGTIHNHCWNKRSGDISDQEEVFRLNQRAADWRLLCPPQYQDSAEWITTPAARKLNHAAVKLALAWEYGFMGLTLHGKKSGTGKTTSAWLIIGREFHAGKFIVATTHKEMCDKATWAAKELTPESKRWGETMRRCDLLFIDDLGKSRFKTVSGEGRASEEFLFDVLDERIKAKLPTMFTVNMTGDELVKAMSTDKGTYFVRRMREFFTNVKFDE